MKDHDPMSEKSTAPISLWNLVTVDVTSGRMDPNCSCQLVMQ